MIATFEDSLRYNDNVVSGRHGIVDRAKNEYPWLLDTTVLVAPDKQDRGKSLGRPFRDALRQSANTTTATPQAATDAPEPSATEPAAAEATAASPATPASGPPPDPASEPRAKDEPLGEDEPELPDAETGQSTAEQGDAKPAGQEVPPPSTTDAGVNENGESENDHGGDADGGENNGGKNEAEKTNADQDIVAARSSDATRSGRSGSSQP
jgi:hypothetical protein